MVAEKTPNTYKPDRRRWTMGARQKNRHRRSHRVHAVIFEDILVRMAAALAKVDATPPPETDWWEAEAGKWTADPVADCSPFQELEEAIAKWQLATYGPDSEPKGSPTTT